MPTPTRTRSQVLVVFLVVALASLPLAYQYLISPVSGRWMVDLQVYREAGVSLLNGRDLYDWRTPPPQNLPFTYPPISAVAAIPFAMVPFGVAGVLWFYLQILANIGLVRLVGAPLIRRAGERGVWVWAGLSVAVVYLLPVADGLRFGQVNVFLVSACLLDVLRPARPSWLRRIPQGVFIGLATAIKLTPGVFLIHLALTRQWRAFATAVLTAASVTVGMFVIMPRSSVTFWFEALRDPERLGRNDGPANQSMRGVLLRLGPEGIPGELIWFLLIAVVAVVGFAAAGRAHRAGARLLEFSCVAVTGVLISPVSWTHHFHWVVPALFVLLGSDPLRHRLRTAGVALLWLVLTLHLTWWGTFALVHQGTWERYLTSGNPFFTLLANSYCLAGIVILVALVRVSGRLPSPPRPSAPRDPVTTPAGSPAAQ